MSAASSMIANAAAAGITPNLGDLVSIPSITNSNSSKEPETQEAKEETKVEEEGGVNWKDPKDFVYFAPQACLTLIALIGVIGSLVSFAVTFGYGVQIVLGLICLAGGLLATFEMWIVGTMQQQVDYLKILRVAMQKDTDHLQNQVLDLSGETQELEQNVLDLTEAGDLLKQNIDQFDGLTETLRQTHASLETQNTELKESVNGLAEQNDKLEETLTAMTSQYDILQEEMEKFAELRESLSSFAADSNEDLSQMVQKTMTKFDAMDSLMHDNEVVLLQQLAADVEFLDESDGMSEKEWNRFHTRLPKRYRRIVDDQGWTFQSLDRNGDGTIDVQETSSIIQDLIRENENKI